jgi:hypothetical protein
MSANTVNDVVRIMGEYAIRHGLYSEVMREYEKNVASDNPKTIKEYQDCALDALREFDL